MDIPVEHRRASATITGLKRRQNSANGNPRYLVYIDTQVSPLRTADDVASAYDVSNFGPGASEGGRPITLALNHRDEIIQAFA